MYLGVASRRIHPSVIWYKSIMLRSTPDIVHIETGRNSYKSLPRPALALVARSVLNKERVFVPLVSGLVTSFGLP
jgi:hypothetical protein